MQDRTCSVLNCTHPTHSRGWCRTHYNRWHKFGDVLADKPVNVRREPPKPEERCEVPTCERAMAHRPWCQPHHNRWLATGDVDADRPIKPRGGPMGTVRCSVEDCSNPSRTRSWCHAHYRRWRKTGEIAASVAIQPKGLPVSERFRAKIDKKGPVPAARPNLGRCYLWIGPVNSSGYGAFNIDGQTFGSHHVGWLLAGGAPFLPGLVLDHLCGVRRCVRRSHLDPVPQPVNMRRAAEAALAAAGRDASLCIKGHLRGDGRCAQCQKEGQKQLQAEMTFTGADRGPRMVMTDELAAEVAKVYLAAVGVGDPPLIALAKHFKRSHSRAGDLARFARNRGFLTAGRASGRNRRARPVRPVGEVVYFVERQGFVKIGFSADLNARLSSLANEVIRVPGMLPGRVNLLAIQPGGRQLERQTHRRFAHLRVGGEWFRAAQDLQDHINSLNDKVSAAAA